MASPARKRGSAAAAQTPPTPADPLEELRELRAEAARRRAEAESLDRRAGRRIAALVRLRTYSYAELSEALGVSRQALQKSAERAQNAP